MQGGLNLDKPIAMHILLVPSWYPTPENVTSGTFFREQAHALSDAGLRVGVIAPIMRDLRCAGRSIFGWRSGICRGNDGQIPTWLYYGWGWLPKIPHGNSRLWLKAGHQLFQRYMRAHGKPDLIHAHCALYGGVLAAQIKQREGIPYVLTEHSTSFARNRIRPWKVPLVKRAMVHAGARIVVSPKLGQVLEAQFGEAARPWTWVPNMVNRRFRPAPGEFAVQERSDFSFLNVGFLHKKKGQADLLRAMALAFRDDRTVHLRIGGDGACMGSLVRLAKQLGIRDQVVFLGNLDRDAVLAEMQSCDCFVLSSHYETFGVVVIEALASGKPVVATLCGGPEYIVHEANGRLVPPRDPRRLAEAMADVRKSIRRYEPESIRRDCLARFSEEAVVRQLVTIGKDTIRANGPPGTRKERAA